MNSREGSLASWWRRQSIRLKRGNSYRTAEFVSPQNGCVSCAHLGICLGDQQLLDAKLIRRPGASDLDWIDQFED